MTSPRPESRATDVDRQFDDQLVRLTIVFAIDVVIVSLVALLKPGPRDAVWSQALVPLATLAAFLPAALGSAALWIRRSRFALTAGTLAAGLTAMFVCCDLLNLNGLNRHGGRIGIAGLLTFATQIAAGLTAKKLAARNVFPLSIRLATFAFVFKLAIVGLLASAFVPPDRNPLRLTGWAQTAEQPVAEEPADRD